MKVLGLISGGKDSIFNLLLCQQYGHTVGAISRAPQALLSATDAALTALLAQIIGFANLMPLEDSVNELDSYMYQTVGHQLVEAYAFCAQLPLFRRRIIGFSKHKDMEYHATQGDEVEDLLSLLAFAKEQLPEIEAVSSGAIASDYQRLRVEHVCSRLGLISLAFLWRQPQAGLLQGMINAEIDAVLVKVAALGLQPAKHLGRNLKQMQEILHDLNRRFGCNICGEGGEYETLTLDCPLFTKARIVLDSWDIVLHSADTFASVGVLQPTAFHTEEKAAAGLTCKQQKDGGPAPPDSMVIEVPAEFSPKAPDLPRSAGKVLLDTAEASVKTGAGLISTFYASKGPSNSESSSGDVKAALHSALAAMECGLRQNGMLLSDAAFVQLWLKDMAHFARANAVYKQYFPMTKPAARACIQAALPSNVLVAVQIILPPKGKRAQLVLHVQSISQWAPSCIGPYSQAVLTEGLVFFAGQIGLHPPTMDLLPSLALQARQCFSSCEAVATAMHIHLGSCLLAATLYSTPEAGQEARSLLQLEVDRLLGLETTTEEETDVEQEQMRDVYLTVPAQPRPWSPVITHLVVPGLPKGAQVEIQPLACSEEGVKPDSNDDSDSSNSTKSPSSRGGWIGNLMSHFTEEGMITSSTLYAPQRFCRFSISALCKESCSHDLASSNRQPHEKTVQPFITSILRRLLQSAENQLQSAQLSGDDVITVQLFYNSAFLESVGHDQTSLQADLNSQIESLSLNWPLQAALVPVLGAGLSPRANADFLLEALCLRAEVNSL